MDFNGNNILNDVEIGNLTITDKGIIQKEIDEFTDSKELVSKEYVDASGGGGDVVGPSNSVDNGVCFYDGTTGKLIKEISTIKYNPVPNVLAVPDLSTTSTTSLNTDLQKITNITSAVNVPVPITTLTGELDVKKIKSYEHNAEIEFDNTNLLLTADGNINISGPIIADTIQCGDASNTEGYTLLDKVNLQFRGDQNTSSAYGAVTYFDNINNKSIILGIDRGNFPNPSEVKIFVDSQIYQFSTTGLDMLLKQITNLAEPDLPQDAATKNYVDGLQPNQPLNTTNNVLFNSVQSTTSINANTVDAITDVTVGVEGVDAVKLTRTLLQFRGDAINTSYGSLSYGDGAVYKTISMAVDKGNFTTASKAIIRVDDGYYYFTPTSLDVVNKRIANLAQPINTQDAATKNYVDTAIAPVLTVANAGGKIKVIFDNTIDHPTTSGGVWTDGIVTVGWDAPDDITQIMVNITPTAGNVSYYVTPGNASGVINTYGVNYPIGSTIPTRTVQRLWLTPSDITGGVPNYLFTLCNLPNGNLTIEKW